MQISQDVLRVLDSSAIVGNQLVLSGQLDRKLYTATNKVIEAAGGKWDRKAKAHVFPEPVGYVIDAIVLTGKVALPADLGQFDTPAELAERLVKTADVQPGMRVLEPSAGIGNLIRPVLEITSQIRAIDIDEKRVLKLMQQFVGLEVLLHNFLELPQIAQFDRVTMNPPFARQADIDHVRHAAGFLKPEGKLVAIMGAGVKFRENQKARSFREWLLMNDGTITDLPENSFRESGTAVRTVLVTLTRRASCN